MVGGEITMRFFKLSDISLNEKRICKILSGVLLSLALLLQPCFADVPVSFTGENQAGMPLDTWNYAKGDYLTFLTPTADNIVLWEWNVDGEKRFITDPTLRNQTFGPFDKSTFIVYLNVTDNTADTGSSVQGLQLNDGSEWITNAEYSAMPDYFDRSTPSKLGTITFWDESISLLEPQTKIDYWWWKVTNLSDGQSVPFEEENHTDPIPMSYTTFSVNVTVKNGLGHLLSYHRNTVTPPDALDLIPNLSVIPKTGIAPLEISVIDQAINTIGKTVYDVPVEYKYRIGNSTTENVFGEEFTEKNLNITLPHPGIYYVNQTITNLFGITKVTNITNVTVYPFKADFTATPSHGAWPLTVSFIDQSVLEPILMAKEMLVQYNWTIRKEGDDTYFREMSGKNPNFTFMNNGTYNVSMNLKLGEINSGVVSKNIIVTNSSGYPNLTLNASFSAVSQFGNPPLSVTFVDTSRKNEPVTYEWDFGDPLQNPLPITTQNPRFTFLNPGDYTVSLKLTGVESGRTSECRQVISVQKLEADFIPRPDLIDPRIMHFNSTTTGFPTLWTWRFGDGIVSRQENVTHQYSAAGTYTVTLTASNKIWSDTITKEVILP